LLEKDLGLHYKVGWYNNDWSSLFRGSWCFFDLFNEIESWELLWSKFIGSLLVLIVENKSNCNEWDAHEKVILHLYII
jgi:hypothetical protein